MSPGMATKATKKHRGKSIQAERQKPTPPKTEYRFDRLDADEYEDCFRYEIQRYRIPQDRAQIQEELASLPADAEGPVGPDEATASDYAGKQELLRFA
jgi:hypothetical protein